MSDKAEISYKQVKIFRSFYFCYKTGGFSKISPQHLLQLPHFQW